MYEAVSGYGEIYRENINLSKINSALHVYYIFFLLANDYFTISFFFTHKDNEKFPLGSL